VKLPKRGKDSLGENAEKLLGKGEVRASDFPERKQVAQAEKQKRRKDARNGNRAVVLDFYYAVHSEQQRRPGCAEDSSGRSKKASSHT
jgi:hypothetical protein